MVKGYIRAKKKYVYCNLIMKNVMLHHVIRRLFAKYKVQTDEVLYKRQCRELATLIVNSVGARLQRILGKTLQVRDQKRIQHVMTMKA